MKRDGLLRLLLAALVVAAGLWLAGATEWVEVQVHRPARGEAAGDRFFATALVLRQLGARVERRQALEPLPPPGARLLLTSQHWNLFPERAAQLRRWVEDGGRLLVPAALVGQQELAAWLPLRTVEREDDPRRRSARGRLRAGLPACRAVSETVRTAGAVADPAPYRLCSAAFYKALVPRNDAQPQWALSGEFGLEALRVPLGRGSVTAFGPSGLLNNDAVLEGDHALLLARALQLEPGAVVWLVTEEARPGLLPWLWQNAWVALLLALAALAAWLWRGAVRFGPVGAPPPQQRRSMREQVAGTGAFLQLHGSAALHGAQLRALLEAAPARLPGAAALPPPALAAAIARATGLPPQELARAMQAGPRPPAQLSAHLELLEAARRRLLPQQGRGTHDQAR